MVPERHVHHVGCPLDVSGQLVVYPSVRGGPVSSRLPGWPTYEVVVRVQPEEVRVSELPLLQPHTVVPLLGPEDRLREPTV